MWLLYGIAIFSVIIMVLYYGLIFYQKLQTKKIVNPDKNESSNNSVEANPTENKYSGMKHVSDVEFDDESNLGAEVKSVRNHNTTYNCNENICDVSSQNENMVTSISIELDNAEDVIFSQMGIFNFIDGCSESANKEWGIFWSDSEISDKVFVSGYRTQGYGVVGILNIKNKNYKLCENLLQRPNNGCIANNGNALVVDYLFGNELSCVVYVFSKNLELLFEKKFSANYLNGDISACGNFIVVQLASSKTNDSNKLILINIADNEIIFSIKSPKIADSYQINTDKKIITVKFPDDDKNYRYNFNGTFLDKDKLINFILLKSDNYHEVIELTTSLLKKNSLDKEIIADILDCLNRLERTIEEKHKYCLPKIYRNKGIAYEMLGNNNYAIKFYKKAIKLDPKIGVKRRLASLLK